jgi:hypothetical protein
LKVFRKRCAKCDRTFYCIGRDKSEESGRCQDVYNKDVNCWCKNCCKERFHIFFEYCFEGTESFDPEEVEFT